MATLDAGRPSRLPHVPHEIDSETESNSSDSVASGHHFDQRNRAVCRWRTPRYYDRECLRYFDCPSHQVERALSDADQDSDGEPTEEHQEQGHGGSEDEHSHSGPGAVSPLSDDDTEPDDQTRARSPSPHVPLAAGEAADRTFTGYRVPDLSRVQQEETGESSSSPISLVDNSSQAEMEVPAASGSSSGDGDVVPPSPALEPLRRDSGTGFAPPALNISAASPAPATRLVTRPSPILSTPTDRARPSEVALPRWQPDSEVTYCPICGTQFSIFVRKHHCRKCGRVVCNSCSPHRITIPYQYIVRPPGAPRPLAQGASLSFLDSQGWYPEFGGGERVRLCNPCVPDPNTAPPQTPGAQARSPSNAGSPIQADHAALSNRWGFYFGAGAANDPQTRSRSVTLQPGTLASARPPVPPPRSNEARILWGTPPAYYRPAATPQTAHLYPGGAPRYRSMLDVGDGPATGPVAGPSSSSTMPRRRPHPVFVPRPPIAEEDECPICHRELPPRTLPNFEALREAHINSCITSHSRYGGPGTTPDEGGGPDALPPMPPRRTGMFPYTATEKDCVDSAECSICLEEFEVGVAMARLECLCRFHRACINAWWERHPGRCPMHQHDGFGY